MKTNRQSTTNSAFNYCLELIKDFPRHKNNFDYKVKLVFALCNWRTEQDNIYNLSFVVSNTLIPNCYITHNGPIVEIPKYDIQKTKCFTKLFDLIDSVLHEINHIKIENDNKNNSSSSNKPPFYFNTVLRGIQKICNYEFDTAFTITLALYSINSNETAARNRTIQQMNEIIEELQNNNQRDNRIIKRMIKFYEKYKLKQKGQDFKTCRQTYSYFESHIKEKIKHFLIEYSKNPDGNNENQEIFKSLCEIFYNEETWNNLINYYISIGDIEKANKTKIKQNINKDNIDIRTLVD